MNSKIANKVQALTLDPVSIFNLAEKLVKVFAMYKQTADLTECYRFLFNCILYGVGFFWYIKDGDEFTDILGVTVAETFVAPFKEVNILFWFGKDGRILLPLRKYERQGYAMKAYIHDDETEASVLKHGFEPDYIVYRKVQT